MLKKRLPRKLMILFAITKRCRLIITVLVVLFTSACSDQSLHLGVTTTLEDSGLLPLLVDEFERKHSIKLKPIVVGSGQLFTLIKRGDIDIAISHEPQGEKLLLAQGIIQQRIPLFYNHFVIIGPRVNPANITHKDTAKVSLKKIQQKQQYFISRGDNSGTHKMELSLQTDVTPSFIVETGTGMGATLSVAINRNAYTLTDKASWLNFANKQQHTILWEKTGALVNPYHLLVLPSQSANAIILKKWLTSEKTHAMIENYQLHEKQLFYSSNIF